MKVSVNAEECTGCELCVNSCPDLFELDGDVAKAKVEIVPEGAEDCARQAVEDCPVSAITIED
ncbi:ferredoxin [candidate division WOR-3 bacterium]|nr:ferredoxin [candidate division WOR-3 bacterium]